LERNPEGIVKRGSVSVDGFQARNRIIVTDRHRYLARAELLTIEVFSQLISCRATRNATRGNAPEPIMSSGMIV
jgi:hypothetical protein